MALTGHPYPFLSQHIYRKEMIQAIELQVLLGQGRHLPYLKRGKKKQTVRQIVKQIRAKKLAIVIFGLYLLGDYLQDGAIDGSLVVSMVNMI
jgi:hypothetical protein